MCRFILLCAAALATFAPIAAAYGQAEGPTKKALAELQGVWKLKTLERAGEAHDLAERPCFWVVKGDKILYGGEEFAVLKVDPATTPKSLDLTARALKAEVEGIYAIQDGVWKLCVQWPTDGTKERPQEFTTKDKPAFRVLTFERVQEKEADVAKRGMGFVGIAIRKDMDDNLFIDNTLPDSPAKKAGLAKNDQLLKVGGVDVSDLLTTVKSIQRLRPGSELTLRIKRDEKERDVKIQVGLAPFHFLVH